MKFLVMFLGICSCVLYIEASCGLYSQELECGKELGLSNDVIATIYHKPNPLRTRYTNCVWKKLEYQNENGEVDYDRIQNHAGALLTIARICDDVPSMDDPGHYVRQLEASIKACKTLLSSLDHSEETAEKVRKCIQEHM